MSMHELELELTLAAPFLSHAAGAMALGVDAAMQKYDGKHVLNGSQIRGNLRHLLSHFAAELNDPDLTEEHIHYWFGPERGTDADTRRAALTFDWAWTLRQVSGAASGCEQDMRYRITLADDGSVEPGHLQVIEAPYPVGTRATFTGHILARIDASYPSLPEEWPDRIEHLRHWLTKAAQALPAVGALKGVGFGRVLQARLSGGEQYTAQTRSARGGRPGKWAAERIGIVLHPDRPFHLAMDVPHQPSSNRRIYPTQIPGAAIKALMARAWLDDPSTHEDLEQRFDFDQLVVTNALPARGNHVGRHPVLPLSLALVDRTESGCKPELVDLALCKSPCLVRVGSDWAAPRFLPDWKERELADVQQQALGNRAPPEVSALLSVRTAIEPDTNVSDEGRLFALEVTEPKDHQWCADIDLALIEGKDRRRTVANHLKELLAKPLYGLGKTAATVTVEVQAKGPCTAPDEPKVRDPLVIMLRSPARLLPDAPEVAGINGDAELRALYDAYFRHISGEQLTLSHYFAQQEMVGGEYYRRHFLPRPDQYHPVWLTRAGSVFVLGLSANAEEADLNRRLQEWTRAGLPPPHGCTTAWDRNPFLRENGFGEIVLNDPLHQKLAPKPADLLTLDPEDGTDVALVEVSR
jgi:hypothetical protein